MRHLLPVVLLPLVAGCATGYASDWFRSRNSIIAPQLVRYGLDERQARCVGERLGQRLGRAGLRRFEERASAVRPAAAAPLTVANLRAIAASTRDAEIRGELDSSLNACNVPLSPILLSSSQVGPPAASPNGGATAGQMTSGGVPVDTTPLQATPGAGGAVAATWLNLGAADSGQSIAIDATSIQQEGSTRTAWFRMTDPDNGGPSSNNYRLRVDCQARTIQPLAMRQLDGHGVQTSLRDYTPAEARPGPAESGTVLEIAFLSLCT